MCERGTCKHWSLIFFIYCYVSYFSLIVLKKEDVITLFSEKERNRKWYFYSEILFYLCSFLTLTLFSRLLITIVLFPSALSFCLLHLLPINNINEPNFDLFKLQDKHLKDIKGAVCDFSHQHLHPIQKCKI